jgi:hypothetical protein
MPARHALEHVFEIGEWLVIIEPLCASAELA